MKRALVCAGLVVGVGLGLHCVTSVSSPVSPTAAATAQRTTTWLVGVEAEHALSVAADHGLELTRTLGSLDAFVLHGPVGVRSALEADPRTRWVDDNHEFRVAAGHSCAPAGATVTSADFTRERRLADTLRGDLAPIASGSTEVVVAVVDTGVDRDHPALRGALLSGRSFLADQPWHQDYAGHGTSMATLIAAQAGEHAGHADQLAGVAPGAKILPLKVANAKGEAKLADVAEAVAYAAGRGAQVILLSLGTIRPAPLLDEALELAESSGSIVIAAAGNRNTNGDAFPAAHSLTVSVGSCFPDGRIAPTTAFSPTTDVLFPGVAALVPRGRSEYSWVSGTSVSAARAAGVAALLAGELPQALPVAWRAVLRDAHRPLELIADDTDAARILSAGPFAPELLAEHLQSDTPQLSLRALCAGPSQGWLEATLHNVSPRTLAPSELELGEVHAVPALAPGQVHTVGVAVDLSGDTKLQASWHGAEQTVTAAVAHPAPTLGRDLALYDVVATPTADGGLHVKAVVESRGLASAGTLRVSLEDAVVGELQLPTLALGERSSLEFEVPTEQVAALPAAEIVSCFVEAQVPDAFSDSRPQNNAASLDLSLTLDPGGAPPVRTLYQQSGELNIVLDAPWRLAPGRSYLPLLVFLPEKGDRSRKTWVRVDALEIAVGGQHADQRQIVFRDTVGEIPIAPQGTQVLDELGNVATDMEGTPDLRMFAHERIYVPGRYNMLCLPREAIVRQGLKAPNSPGEVNYVEATAEWSNRRKFLWIFRRTAHGTSRRVMRVQFPNDARPQLLPGGQYLDTHVHTIAEWYQGSWLNLLAPRKNWGGPIPMLKESAYAIGLTKSVDAVRDRVITSDHNAFYNHRNRSYNTLKHRPPFGPTGSAMSGKTERQVMQDIFGETCAEEVAFNAQQSMVGSIKLPLGAHMLTYRAQHISGAWHGGSTFARLVGSPYKKTKLEEVIPNLTKQNRAENASAAIFAAHPANGGQGWSAKHLDLAFELNPEGRNDRSVHAEMTGFLHKGLQLWNGEFGRHSMPPGTIFWGDLDPWNDDEFRAGDPNWDQEINQGIRQWSEVTAKALTYELASYPGVRFPRKVFMLAGSDAHGDFNGTEDRMATMVGAQATFDVDGNAYGKVLTYAMPRGDESPLDAMVAGRTVLTDGPLLDFSVDADTRWDPTQQCWDETATRFADQDGQIGGGGPFDGQGTALVARGAPGVRLGFRYVSNREWGPLKRVALYLTSPDTPTPMGQRETGGTLPLPAQTFATVGPNMLHQAELPGPIMAPTAINLGGYSRDPSELRTDDRRCLTNAVYAVPYDFNATVAKTEVDAAGNGSIPAGALRVRFTFDMSLRPLAYAVEIKALSSAGRSTAVETGPIDVLTPVGTWTACGTHLDAVYELTNARPIPLNLERFGSDAEAVTFVVSFRDAPQDPFGNVLNRIAGTFQTPGIGSGGGVGPAIDRGPETSPEFLGMVAHLGAKPTQPADAVTEGPADLATGDASRPPVRDGLSEEPEFASSPLGDLERRLAAAGVSETPISAEDELNEAAEAAAAAEALGLNQPASPTTPVGVPADLLGAPVPVEVGPISEGSQPLPLVNTGSSGSHLGSGFGFELGPTADTDRGLDRSRVRATDRDVSPSAATRVPAKASGGEHAGHAHEGGAEASSRAPRVNGPAGLAGGPREVPRSAARERFDESLTTGNGPGGAVGALGGGEADDSSGCSLSGPASSGWPALFLLALLGLVPALRRWA